MRGTNRTGRGRVESWKLSYGVACVALVNGIRLPASSARVWRCRWEGSRIRIFARWVKERARRRGGEGELGVAHCRRRRVR